jgi:catechol 2,3-dioxygenase-like lactoylglutathione lyase family enzyme
MKSDSFDGLRLPIVPIDPRPEFTDALLLRMEDPQRSGAGPSFTPTVRYFVNDLDTAVAFYCQRLDFDVELRPSPMFAMLYRGDLRLLLSVPGVAHALPDGRLPEPGGWNRMALQVDDLPGVVAALREGDTRLRTDIVTGVGVQQILLEDPSGNLVELFEPTAGYHERRRDRKDDHRTRKETHP